MTTPHLPLELAQRLRRELSPGEQDALDRFVAICRTRGAALYLVGGAVRDLLLRREGIDIDLAVDQEVASLAAELAGVTAGRAVVHQRFGTASIKGGGFSFDIARLRRESYPHPGSLPQVEPASLAEDLQRRDFSINAMALRLSPEPFELFDPYRGVADARDGLVRVLHERSFQDDATRMLRAARYAARLEFKIARQTEGLLKRDLGYLGTISGPRLRRELGLMFQERRCADAALLTDRLGILNAIHPALRVIQPVAQRWRAALGEQQYGALDELGFCVITDPREDGVAASVSQWLHLKGRYQRALEDLVRLRALSPKLATGDKRPSHLTELLDGYVPSAIWGLAVLEGGDTAEMALTYLRQWRHVKPRLSGRDLLDLGIEPGRQVGEALRGLRASRLDGAVATREQEMEMVREMAATAKGSPR